MRGLAFATLVAAVYFMPNAGFPSRQGAERDALTTSFAAPDRTSSQIPPAEPPAWAKPPKKQVPEMNGIVLEHYLKSFRSALSRGDDEVARKYATALAKAGPRTRAAVEADPYLASEMKRLSSVDVAVTREQ